MESEHNATDEGGRNVNYAALVGALMHFANTERDMATTEIDGPLWRGTRAANHAAEGELRRMFIDLTVERDRYRTALESYPCACGPDELHRMTRPAVCVRCKALRPAPAESEVRP